MENSGQVTPQDLLVPFKAAGTGLALFLPTGM